MNRVCLVGRLTTKPELRYTGSNKPVTSFSLAVNRTFTNQDGQREADFINCVVWNKQAENVCNYLDKGSQVSIEGRIQTGSYTDKDGNKRTSFDIQVDNVQFLESKKSKEITRVENTPVEPANDDPFKDFGDTVSIDDNFLD